MENNPDDWYWVVTGDTDRVFSSGAAGWVSSSAPAYLAWLDKMRASPDPMTRHLLGAGRLPTRAASYADLFEALVRRAPAVARAVASDFIGSGYLTPSQTSRWLLSNGVTATCADNHALNGVYRCDEDDLKKMRHIIMAPTPYPVVGWRDITGNVHRFPPDKFHNFADGVTWMVASVHAASAAADVGHPVTWPTMHVDL
jgi:hypothetical protein